MDRILHAGFHKTGSTFLQKNVFPHFEGIEYLGNFNLAAPGCLSNGNSFLFSSEAACGYPYPYTANFSIEQLDKNIQALNINKVILFRRDFPSWCLSLYFQTLNENHTWSLSNFLKQNKNNLLTWKSADADIEDYCAKNNINIIIMDYKDLSNTPEKSIEKIASFIGCKSIKTPSSRENQSRYGSTTIIAYRILNFICRSKIIFGILKLISLTPRKIIQGRIGAFFEKLSFDKVSPSDVQRVLK
ncbi:sulfotransferase domain-containing protein [Halomonas piscis]|uniref:Sulfotransferase domain-containing protein n=1 Tax=Halomonas piscis TaxID=3031727 RepID=A0ABY9YZ20_9GAMM|nr:sulfotransferase domain-containing protein [Halomonas piscis]WNK20114.1 sulfotransferase domain-containing protein [Halomonas piscis]